MLKGVWQRVGTNRAAERAFGVPGDAVGGLRHHSRHIFKPAVIATHFCFYLPATFHNDKPNIFSIIMYMQNKETKP